MQALLGPKRPMREHAISRNLGARARSWVLGALGLVSMVTSLTYARPLSAPARLGVLPEPPGADDVELKTAPKTVVIVVIDGARWQEIFEGVDARLARQHGMKRAAVVPARSLFPELHALVENGGAALGAPGHGADISATGPAYLSLPGYMELFSGLPARHCSTNHCRPIKEQTLVDDLAEETDPERIAVISSWTGILRAVARDGSHALVSAGKTKGTHLEILRADPEARKLYEIGAKAGAYPGEDDYRPDRYTAALALHWLRAHRPRFLFVSLGDADSLAHYGAYERYLAALHESDAVIGELKRALDELDRSGWPTALFVTADHGRDRHCRDHGASAPESARSWLVASGAGIRTGGFVTARRPRFLADVAPTVRSLLGLPQRDSGGEVLTELVGEPDTMSEVSARR